MWLYLSVVTAVDTVCSMDSGADRDVCVRVCVYVCVCVFVFVCVCGNWRFSR